MNKTDFFKIFGAFAFAAAILLFDALIFRMFIPDYVFAHKSTDTNISYLPGEFWGWNDVVGWIDFHNTHSVMLTEDKLKGYASSSAGYFLFDCSTTPMGSICNDSNFKVLNDTNGNLTGWAWNDIYGWVSFCGGQGTSDCPGNIPYRVQVDMSTGVFKGEGDDYAWNDAVGWISFNCANHGSCGINYKVVAGRADVAEGTLESTTFDTGSSAGAQINSVMWRGDLSGGTHVYFQIAASQSSNGPWNNAAFLGPDGTSNTSYGPVAPNSSYKLDWSLHNNKRYFRYKVKMYSSPWGTQSPRVDEVIINWSP